MPSVFLVSLLVLLFDQLTKYEAQIFLASTSTTPVIRNIFHLTLVRNQGAAFGFFQGGVFFFIMTSFICIGAIVLAMKNNALFFRFFGVEARDKWVRLALGLILGGACGNLIDRLRLSYVIDFLDFRVWPVFNIADSAITLGGILIFLKILKTKPGSKNASGSL